MLKKWHPDNAKKNNISKSEATRKTTSINKAYDEALKKIEQKKREEQERQERERERGVREKREKGVREKREKDKKGLREQRRNIRM